MIVACGDESDAHKCIQAWFDASPNWTRSFKDYYTDWEIVVGERDASSARQNRWIQAVDKLSGSVDRWSYHAGGKVPVGPQGINCYEVTGKY